MTQDKPKLGDPQLEEWMTQLLKKTHADPNALATDLKTLRRLQWQLTLRHFLNVAAVYALYSAGAAFLLTLLLGVWHARVPAAPAPGFLLLWFTIFTARAVWTSVLWVPRRRR